MSCLDGDLFQESAAGRDGFALLMVGCDHFAEGVLKQFTAFFQGCAFCDDFRPIDKLAHVAGRDLCVAPCVSAHVSIVAHAATAGLTRAGDSCSVFIAAELGFEGGIQCPEARVMKRPTC